MAYIGSQISLISKSDIRYVGTLHDINQAESTVALENVTSFGTEGRKGNPHEEIPPGDHIYAYIQFRGSDIKDLHVVTAAPAPPARPPQIPDDPAIIGAQTQAPMPPGFNAFSGAPSMAMQAGGGPAPPFGTPPGMNPYMMQQQGMPFQQQHRPLPPGPGAQTYWRPPVGQQQPTGTNDLPPQHLPQAPVGPTLTSQSGTTPSGVDAGASPDAGTDLAHDLDGLQISGQPKAEAGAAQPVIEKGKGKEDKQVEGGSGGKTQGAGKALTVGSGGQSKPGVLAEKAEPTEPVTSVPAGSRPNRHQQVQQQEGRIDDGQISGRETALDNDQQNEAPVNGSGEANARLPGVGAHLLQSNRRGGGRGGRGRGGFGPRGNRIVIPDQDYDFESANAKFNKTDVAQEAGKDEKSPTAIEGEQAPSDDGEDLESPTTFYKKSSFFDDISCESKDRADGDRVNRRARQYEERRLNLETFGQTGMDPNRSGYGRGGYRGHNRRGGRGYSGRGGYGYHQQGGYHGHGSYQSGPRHRGAYGGSYDGLRRGRGGPRRDGDVQAHQS